MEAEQVIEKILSDAKAEADKIVREAEAKVAAEKARADAELAEYRQQADTLAQQAAEDEKSHILAAARMEAAKEYLAEKTRILDTVFERAEQRLAELPDNEYRKLMGRLMVEAVETGEEEVLIGKNESRIDQSFINRINGKLEGDKKRNLKLADERHDLPGGFVLRRGKIKTNVSPAVLLEQARNALVIDLAKTLFS
ncbi:MAG: V-type ATP synthase subunit E [Phycisphaerales bacterium]|nr:MAG: V-type ATP synthase subunit E [Phycisphaerales bacterium]